MKLTDELDSKINQNNNILTILTVNQYDDLKYLFFCELLNYNNLYRLTYNNGQYNIKLSELIKNPDKYSSALILQPSKANSGDNKLSLIYALLQKEIS